MLEALRSVAGEERDADDREEAEIESSPSATPLAEARARADMSDVITEASPAPPPFAFGETGAVPPSSCAGDAEDPP